MDIEPLTETPAPAPRLRHWRHLAAGALAGGVLTAAVAVPVTLGLSGSGATATQSTGTADTPTTTQQRLPGGTFPGSGGGSAGGYGGGQLPSYGSGRSNSTGETSETDATDAQSQGLVLIDTVLPDGEAAGTGMVLESDGVVLTNYHVVEGSTSITVTDAATGQTYDATVIGHDATADVALLQLQDASGLTPVTIDDDGEPATGDTVTAVGNAEGQGYLSASTGTVQALDQSITTSATQLDSGEALTDLIQTSAYVVGGYSGGALLDAEGEVVGITTAASAGGVVESYAVPIEDALAVVAQIDAGTANAQVQIGASAYLGVSVDQALQVGGVETGTAASEAGIAAGDTLTAVDGTTVSSLDQLSATLATLAPGASTTVTWTDASGASQQATVTLGSSPVN